MLLIIPVVELAELSNLLGVGFILENKMGVTRIDYTVTKL
jgi:hypothetical protein